MKKWARFKPRLPHIPKCIVRMSLVMHIQSRAGSNYQDRPLAGNRDLYLLRIVPMHEPKPGESRGTY